MLLDPCESCLQETSMINPRAMKIIVERSELELKWFYRYRCSNQQCERINLRPAAAHLVGALMARNVELVQINFAYEHQLEGLPPNGDLNEYVVDCFATTINNLTDEEILILATRSEH